MSDYLSLSELFAGVKNAVHVVNNTAHDDDTVALTTGIDWFKFNGNPVSNLYVSGNSWIGLGASNESNCIKVDRRDAKLWDLWTETGMIGDTKKFRYYRWRWSGFSQYNSTSDSTRLVWDCALFDNGTIYLNIVNWPTSYTDGTNVLVAAASCAYSPTSTKFQFTFTRGDDNGTSWTVQDGLLEPAYVRILYLYSDQQNFVYSYSSTEQSMTKILDLTKEQLTAQNFIDHGTVEKAPWSVIQSHLNHPCILKWKDGTIEQNIYAVASGTPVPQLIQSVADLSSATIKGIKAITSVYEGNVSVSYSYDNSSWTDFSDLAAFLQTDLVDLYHGLGVEKKIHFKIKLNDAQASFTNLVMQYQN
jgi:hypothetical protein